MIRSASLAIGSAVLLVVVLAVGVIELTRERPAQLTPTLTGQTEYCITCHAELPEISAAHPLETFGCVQCHGGERLALDEDLAHSTMRGEANPSDFTVAGVGPRRRGHRDPGRHARRRARPRRAR